MADLVYYLGVVITVMCLVGLGIYLFYTVRGCPVFLYTNGLRSILIVGIILGVISAMIGGHYKEIVSTSQQIKSASVVGQSFRH